MLELAENHMRENRPGDALEAYRAAWPQVQQELDHPQRVWLLLSLANAAVRSGDFEEAFAALAVLPEHYAETRIVVGNPLFHLLVGLCFDGLQEQPDAATDNFARALICGGQEIFAGESPEHLQRMKEILRPPAETGTWDGYTGCSVDLLNGATGYLRELLTTKYGAPPPYS